MKTNKCHDECKEEMNNTVEDKSKMMKAKSDR